MRNLTYKTLRSLKDLPEDIVELMNYNDLKVQCQTRNKQIKDMVRRMNSEHEHERQEAHENLQRYVTKIFFLPILKCFYNILLLNLSYF